MGKEWDSFKDSKRSNGWAIAYDGEQNDKVENNGFSTKMRPSYYNRSKQDRDNFIAFLTAVMTEALRVLKPGGHALIWALPRTSHWTATALEDAGFEVRDKLYHLFGSGFPKSLDVGKAIDRMRDDNPDVLQVTKWLNKQVKRANITYASILAHFGFNEGSGQIGHWTALSNGAQPTVPTWEQWQELKSLLGFDGSMDAEVWRLNGRKGKPGDAWNEREVIGERRQRANSSNSNIPLNCSIGDVEQITAPATPEAQQWAGYGTALKPSVEEWILCRKPLSEHSIAAQVLATGTGGLNIDACRVGATSDNLMRPERRGKGVTGGWSDYTQEPGMYGSANGKRFPSHLLLSHSVWCVPRGTRKIAIGGGQPHEGNERISKNVYNGLVKRNSSTYHGDTEGYETVEAYDCAPECPIRELDQMGGYTKSSGGGGYHPSGHDTRNGIYGKYGERNLPKNVGKGDEGHVSRYFTNFPPSVDSPDFVPFAYHAKASRRERNAGCEDLPSVGGNAGDVTVMGNRNPVCQSCGGSLIDRGNGICQCDTPVWKATNKPQTNTHPTVKSTALMSWLIRLITPPNGVVLDPFGGSGSTAVAAIQEGKHFILIEQDESYVNIARARIEYARTHEPEVVKVATKKVRLGGGRPIEGNQRKGGTVYNGLFPKNSSTYHGDQDGLEEIEDWDCAPECPIRILGEQSGERKSAYPGNTERALLQVGRPKPNNKNVYSNHDNATQVMSYSDQGTAARYFQQFPPDLWQEEEKDVS